VLRALHTSFTLVCELNTVMNKTVDIWFPLTDDPAQQGNLNTIIKRELHRFTTVPYTLRYSGEHSIIISMRPKHFTLWQLTWNPTGSPYFKYNTTQKGS